MKVGSKTLLGEAVIEQFVSGLGIVLMIELPQQVSQGFDAAGTQGGEEGQGQAKGGDRAQPSALSCLSTESIEFRFGKSILQEFFNWNSLIFGQPEFPCWR